MGCSLPRSSLENGYQFWDAETPRLYNCRPLFRKQMNWSSLLSGEKEEGRTVRRCRTSR